MKLRWLKEKHPVDGSPVYVLRDENNGPVAMIGHRNATIPRKWGFIGTIIAPGMLSGPQSDPAEIATQKD